jgi:hypothetical protein
MEDSDRKIDSYGRLISDFSSSTGTLTTYEYGDKWRKITITNSKNRSNHTTIIEQNISENGNFIDSKKTEEGDVYIIKTTYDDKGREKQYEQINKIKQTNLIKTTYRPGEGETCVYIMNYNGNKEIGFKADAKKLRPKS